MDELTPIREVADRFGLPLSTLHYWERRGLVEPHRRSGRRYFDSEQVYRVALIQLWRETGLMSVGEIRTLLQGDAGPVPGPSPSPRAGTDTNPDPGTSPGTDWRQTVLGRVAALDAHIARLGAARTYLTHLLSCDHGPDLERCPDFRATVPGVRPPAQATGPSA
ncbi:MerR family transcriptional regulator [Streptomyces sp. p1417]|uniref:MerR family transcriptional regulator n=1 Tax=Streptomyces typhae TaxID=2681492 RepID=A0A6L6WT31_9ACTN|nr:MerR family transcriptional regulator [Streptomyces typhae]MVO85415.1 MerR family transcriptional regulator [Streptomyces typhae]